VTSGVVPTTTMAGDHSRAHRRGCSPKGLLTLEEGPRSPDGRGCEVSREKLWSIHGAGRKRADGAKG